MTRVPDAAVDRLCAVLDWPDLAGTRYALRAPLGAGGMGTVYCVHDQALDREVALKVLTDPLCDTEAAERLLREARIIAGLEHPGVVPIHDVGSLPDGRLFYVMKRVRGRRLDEEFDGQASLGDRLRVFERICDTVAFAHAHGVIHRDLKPQNVMIGAFGEVLVLDWGVARILSASRRPDEHADGRGTTATDAGDPDRTLTRRTARGTVLGTPAYMAPEQARGELEALDARSDVYGLGGILYFLLTGTAPLRGRDFERLQRGEAVEVRSPRLANRAVPKALAAVCRKALALDKTRRYGNAAALREDVRRFLDGAPVAAYRENAVERLGRAVRAYRTPIVLVAAYLVMRAALALWT